MSKYKEFSRTHELKIEPAYFERIVSGQKRFEIRKDDRDFQVGDWIKLSSAAGVAACKIVYKSTYEQKDGYCVLGFTLGEENHDKRQNADERCSA